MKGENIKYIVGMLFFVLLFIFSTYLVQTNLEAIKGMIKDNLWSIVIYILILIAVAIIAPIDAAPLIPIANAIWGWFYVAILTLIGWTIGSCVVFIMCRRFGVPLVSRFMSIEKIQKYEGYLSNQHFFWSVVFLRMLLPADVISYALGLFSSISFTKFLLSTLIAFLPFAFLYAYFGSLPLYVQIIAFICLIAIILFALLAYWLGYHRIRKRRSMTHKKNN